MEWSGDRCGSRGDRDVRMRCVVVSRCGPEADSVMGKALVCVALNSLRDTTQLPENVCVVGMKLRPVPCSGISGFFYSAFNSFFMRKPVFISFYYFSPLLSGITL